MLHVQNKVEVLTNLSGKHTVSIVRLFQDSDLYHYHSAKHLLRHNVEAEFMKNSVPDGNHLELETHSAISLKFYQDPLQSIEGTMEAPYPPTLLAATHEANLAAIS